MTNRRSLLVNPLTRSVAGHRGVDCCQGRRRRKNFPATAISAQARDSRKRIVSRRAVGRTAVFRGPLPKTDCDLENIGQSAQLRVSRDTTWQQSAIDELASSDLRLRFNGGHNIGLRRVFVSNNPIGRL